MKWKVLIWTIELLIYEKLLGIFHFVQKALEIEKGLVIITLLAYVNRKCSFICPSERILFVYYNLFYHFNLLLNAFFVLKTMICKRKKCIIHDQPQQFHLNLMLLFVTLENLRFEPFQMWFIWVYNIFDVLTDMVLTDLTAAGHLTGEYNRGYIKMVGCSPLNPLGILAEDSSLNCHEWLKLLSPLFTQCIVQSVEYKRKIVHFKCSRLSRWLMTRNSFSITRMHNLPWNYYHKVSFLIYIVHDIIIKPANLSILISEIAIRKSCRINPVQSV